jgi:ribosome-binding factor A
MVKRIEKVDELMRRELNNIFLKDIEFPEGALVTIPRVKTSSNLIQAKVYISVLPDEMAGRIFTILNMLIYGIQQKINKRLKMRPMPRIEFKKEEMVEKAAKVEELLANIKIEEE